MVSRLSSIFLRMPAKQTNRPVLQEIYDIRINSLSSSCKQAVSTFSNTYMADKPIQSVNYGLVRILTEQLDLAPEGIDQNGPVRFSTSVNFGIDNRERLLKTLFKGTFIQNERPFITIETGCIFAINPEAWELFSDPENNRFIIPRPFASHLAMLTASTARGILHNETDRTPLNRFIIPATNIEEMIREDVQLPL
jgi:hypothetical protein